MCPIGDVASGLEKRDASFTVESLANELRQEWVEDALSQAGRESIRVRLLPATLTVWLSNAALRRESVVQTAFLANFGDVPEIMLLCNRCRSEPC